MNRLVLTTLFASAAALAQGPGGPPQDALAKCMSWECTG